MSCSSCFLRSPQTPGLAWVEVLYTIESLSSEARPGVWGESPEKRERHSGDEGRTGYVE